MALNFNHCPSVNLVTISLLCIHFFLIKLIYLILIWLFWNYLESQRIVNKVLGSIWMGKD